VLVHVFEFLDRGSVANGGIEMRTAVLLTAAVLLLAGVAAAQVHYEFHCSGTGNMVAVSPPIYGGEIDGGDLASGIWQMEVVEDGSWPAPGNPAVRWAYIWTTYYVYDPGSQTWTGLFDCLLDLEKTGEGTMTGVNDLVFQIIDMDGDGELDPSECMDGMSGAVIIIHDGTGIYAPYCGDGTYEGFYLRDCSEGSTYMLDNVDFNMQLDLEDCAMANGASTWGAVKALFE
jgi:hypothetical protein